MADAVTLSRIARTLAQTADATPKAGDFWTIMAQAAASAYEQTPSVTQVALPPEPFLAVLKQQGDGFTLIAKGPTLLSLQDPAMTYLQAKGPGPAMVYAVEVKRVYQVS